MPRNPDLGKRWLTFLRNHREAIAAMDFFTVPTLTFGVLYCFFVISHDRRKILRCNVTRNPSALWIGQQLCEAWPYARAQRFLLFDRDAKFGKDVISAAKKLGTEPIRTAFRSPWQNGVAERWVGSCRRDLLDHVIVLNERHLKRLLRDYIGYYHEDRTHLGLAKDTPEDAQSRATRPTEAGFTRWLDLVACIIVTPWQRKTRRPTCNLWHSSRLHALLPIAIT
jgi:transposase InsO family protein